MSYDIKCFDLAEEFLDDYSMYIRTKTEHRKLEGKLAQEIQDAIEQFLEEHFQEAT